MDDQLIIQKLAAGPMNIRNLATAVARETGVGFQNVVADIWGLIGEGVADYDASAQVSLVAVPDEPTNVATAPNGRP